MPSAQTIQCLLIWQHAKAQDIGLLVKTNNPMKFRAAMYSARKQLNDPELDDMAIRTSKTDPNHEVFIFKQSVVNGFMIKETENAL